MSNAKAFQKFVGNFGDASWVVLFVQADIERVTDAYEQQTERTAQRNVEIQQSAGPSDHHFAPTGCIVQVRDSEWVIVFHLIGQWDRFDCVGLSNRLDAKLLEFCAEDTSGAVECQLYEPKFGVTRYQTAADSDREEDLYDEMLDMAAEAGHEISQPKPATGVESYQELFDSLGIATVEISISETGVVNANPEQMERIVRVDRGTV